MAARGEMRNWAKRDRTIVPPQRAYARSMRANPTDAEVDGGQHAERVSADVERTGVFEANGYRVLRSWNNDVLANINGVLVDIQHAIIATPTPNPSPQGGGEHRRARGE